MKKYLSYLFFVYSSILFSQTWYRLANVNSVWSTISNWQISTNGGGDWMSASNTPTNSNSDKIIIQSGFSVTLNSYVTVDQMVIEEGGNVYIRSNGELSIADGAGIDLEVAGALYQKTGVISGSGTMQINALGVYNIDSSQTKYFKSCVCNNYGTINWNEGNISFEYSAKINIQSGGIFYAKANASINPYSSGMAINNYGTFRRNTGTGTCYINVPLNNYSTLEIQSGELLLASSGTFFYSINISNSCTLTFQSGTHTFSDSTNFNGSGTLQITGATLQITGTTLGTSIGSNIITNQTSGEFTGGGKLDINGIYNWSGGSISISGITNFALGTICNLNTGSIKYFRNGTLNNYGTFNWNDGNFNIETNGTFNNQSSGLFDIKCDKPINTYNSNMSFRNYGLVKKSSGTGNTTFNVPFYNYSDVIIETGRIRLVSSGTHTGPFNIYASAVLELYGGNNTFSDSTFIRGSGTFQITAPMNVAGSVNGTRIDSTILTYLIGTIEGGGKLTIPGNMLWENGTIQMTGRVDFLSGSVVNMNTGNIKYFRNGTLNNYGTFNWNDGNFNIETNGTFNNQSSGLFDIKCDRPINTYNSNMSFRNYGLVKKSSGTGNTTLNVPFYNYSNVYIQTGSIIFAGGGTFTKDINISNGASCQLTGGVLVFSDSSTFTGSGTLYFSGATVQFNGTGIGTVIDSTILCIITNSFGGSGKVTIKGPVKFNSGNINGSLTVDFTSSATIDLETASTKYLLYATINNSGTWNWKEGHFEMQYSCRFNNLSGGIFDIKCNYNINIYSWGMLFVNSGIFRKTSGTGNNNISPPFNNSGIVQIQTGSVTFYSDGTHTGNFDISAGSIIYLNGGNVNMNNESTVTGSGKIVIQGSNLYNNISLAENPEAGSLIIPVNMQLIIKSGSITGNGIYSIEGKFTYEGGTVNPTNNFVYTSTGVLEYASTFNHSTTNKEFPPSNGPATVIINKSGTLNLHAPRTISNTLYLTSGGIYNTDNNLTFTDMSTINRNTGTFTVYPVLLGNINIIYSGSISVNTHKEIPQNDTVYNLTISNTAGVTLTQNIKVLNQLSFTAGKLNTTTSYNVNLGTSGSISGESSGIYLVGTLNVTRNVGTSSSSFGGIGLSINAGTNNLGNVYVTRYSGDSARVSVNGNQSIKRKWVISSDNPPSDGRTLTFSWLADDDGLYFSGSNKAKLFRSGGGGSWTAMTGYVDVSSSNPRSITATGVSSFSTWTVTDSLNSSQLRALQLTCIPEGFYNQLTGKTIPDTLIVILRNITAPYSAVDTAIAISDSSGVTTLLFDNAVNDVNYYIVVKHRNSLETWSSAGQPFSNNTATYNFTSASSQAYGNNMVQKGTKWCIYSGDVNQDGQISLDDLLAIDVDNQNFETGYRVTDINGDGQITLDDLLITDVNNQNFVSVQYPGGKLNKRSKSLID